MINNINEKLNSIINEHVDSIVKDLVNNYIEAEEIIINNKSFFIDMKNNVYIKELDTDDYKLIGFSKDNKIYIV